MIGSLQDDPRVPPVRNAVFARTTMVNRDPDFGVPSDALRRLTGPSQRLSANEQSTADAFPAAPSVVSFYCDGVKRHTCPLGHLLPLCKPVVTTHSGTLVTSRH